MTDTNAAPYAAIFGRPEFEDTLFPALRSEAEELNADSRDAEEFLQLPSATEVLEKLSPTGSAEPPPVTGVVALAFHGFHFWRCGRAGFTIDEAQLRTLLGPDAPPIGDWAIAAPGDAGYVTLPPNLVWAAPDSGTPEPVHGFFYTVSPATTESARLALLLALGVREDRPGFTAIELGVPLPAPPPGHFGDIDARADAEDFANVLPGGDLRALLSLTNAGEVLKMVSRIFHQLAHAA